MVRSWGLGLATTEEPTGIDFDPVNNRLFVTNDDGDYHIITPGGDGTFGTGDDGDTMLSVAGSDDTEDPTYDPMTNRLYVLNGGASGRIYVLNPNTGQSVASNISLTSFGPTDWEGLTMTPNGELLVGANLTEQIFVLETNGAYLETISLSSIGLDRISGLGISPPGGGGSGYDIWVADRQGTSNNANLANIDGRLWRLSTSGAPPTNTPPTISVTKPSPGETAVVGSTVTFQATANDPQDGDISANIVWSSDGILIGSGGSFTKSDLSQGAHVITASCPTANSQCPRRTSPSPSPHQAQPPRRPPRHHHEHHRRDRSGHDHDHDSRQHHNYDQAAASATSVCRTDFCFRTDQLRLVASVSGFE